MKNYFVAAAICFLSVSFFAPKAGAWAGSSAPTAETATAQPPAEWQSYSWMDGLDVRSALKTAIWSTNFSDCTFADLTSKYGIDSVINAGQTLERHQTGDDALRITVGQLPPAETDRTYYNLGSYFYAQLTVHLTPNDKPPQKIVSMNYVYKNWSVKSDEVGTIESPKTVYRVEALPSDQGSATCTAVP